MFHEAGGPADADKQPIRAGYTDLVAEAFPKTGTADDKLLQGAIAKAPTVSGMCMQLLQLDHWL